MPRKVAKPPLLQICHQERLGPRGQKESPEVRLGVFVRVLPSNGTNGCVYKEIYSRIWLTQLRRLRSPRSEDPRVLVRSESKHPGPGELIMYVPA